VTPPTDNEDRELLFRWLALLLAMSNDITAWRGWFETVLSLPPPAADDGDARTR
jgi:hypothetical protein